MPPWGWGNFLVPLFQTSSWQQITVQRDQYWTSSYYAGIGVVFLVVVALWRARQARVWLLGGILLASLVLALGNNGFVFGPLKRILPFLGMFRYPVKFVILTVATAPLLAAYAVASYENAARDGRGQWLAEFCIGVGMLVLVGVILWVARSWPVENTSWPATAANARWRALFLGLTFLTVGLFARWPWARRWSVLLLVAVCWGDLVTHMPWQNPTLDPALYAPGFGRTDAKLSPDPVIARSRLMMSPFSARQLYYKPVSNMKTNYVLDRIEFLADCNLLDHLPKVDGFFSLALRGTDRVLWLLDRGTGLELDRLEDFLSVSQTIAPGKVFDWVTRTNFIPIVTIGQEPLFADDESVFAELGNIRIDFRQVTCLPPEAKSLLKAQRQPEARILATDFTPSRQRMRVRTPGPALLVLTQSYYHNWKAAVDGAVVPLWRANYAFQAVEVPAGEHEVILAYQDKALLAGFVVSLLTVGGCLFGWFVFEAK